MTELIVGLAIIGLAALITLSLVAVIELQVSGWSSSWLGRTGQVLGTVVVLFFVLVFAYIIGAMTLR